MNEKVLVIGAGVSGLTTSLCLLRRGFAVIVVAEKFAPYITSVVAGALWEWPPAVCGYWCSKTPRHVRGLNRLWDRQH